MLRYLPIVLVVAFTVYCVVDVLGSDERRRRGLPVPVWLLLVLLLPVLGGVVWLVVGRGTSRGHDGRGRGGPVAPDDDPEFLHRLDQERRRREQQRGTPPDGGTGGGDATGTTDGPPAA